MSDTRIAEAQAMIEELAYSTLNDLRVIARTLEIEGYSEMSLPVLRNEVAFATVDKARTDAAAEQAQRTDKTPVSTLPALVSNAEGTRQHWAQQGYLTAFCGVTSVGTIAPELQTDVPICRTCSKIMSRPASRRSVRTTHTERREAANV